MKIALIIASSYFIMYQDFQRIFQMREGSSEAWQRWESIKGAVGRLQREMA